MVLKNSLFCTEKKNHVYLVLVPVDYGFALFRIDLDVEFWATIPVYRLILAPQLCFDVVPVQILWRVLYTRYYGYSLQLWLEIHVYLTTRALQLWCDVVPKNSFLS